MQSNNCENESYYVGFLAAHVNRYRVFIIVIYLTILYTIITVTTVTTKI